MYVVETEASECMVYLHCKLCKFTLLTVRIEGAASQVCLEVIENDFVSWDNHSTCQRHKPPVLSIDATIWILGRERFPFEVIHS